MKLPSLYEKDETAWLESMSQLIEARRFDQLDYENLASYLNDMALRDRREAQSRLMQLMVHLLKWIYQPEHRTKSWLNTILEQRDQLQAIVDSKVLKDHLLAGLEKVHAKARQHALIQTGLPESAIPTKMPFSFEQILADGWPKDLKWQPKRRSRK
jgi:hypothetical protein